MGLTQGRQRQANGDYRYRRIFGNGLTPTGFDANVLFVRVWLTPSEARQLRRQAMVERDAELADRLYRAERADTGNRPPFLWRWRARHPLLVQCVCCEEWATYAKHRHLKRDGWIRHGLGWIHADCLEEWEERASEILKQRGEARRRRDALDYLFGHPRLLETYRGVFVRYAPWQEHTFFGLLDDMEASIQAEFGMQRVRNVIDEMAEDDRARLVGAAFTGYQYRYHLLLAWADAIPPDYANGKEVDDVGFESVIVDDLPRALREQLPESLRALL